MYVQDLVANGAGNAANDDEEDDDGEPITLSDDDVMEDDLDKMLGMAAAESSAVEADDSAVGAPDEGVVESAVVALDGVVESAVGALDGVVESAVGALHGVVESAVGASDSLVESAVGASDSLVESAVGASDSVVESAVGASDGVVESTVGAPDAVVDFMASTQVVPSDALMAWDPNEPIEATLAGLDPSQDSQVCLPEKPSSSGSSGKPLKEPVFLISDSPIQNEKKGLQTLNALEQKLRDLKRKQEMRWDLIQHDTTCEVYYLVDIYRCVLILLTSWAGSPSSRKLLWQVPLKDSGKYIGTKLYDGVCNFLTSRSMYMYIGLYVHVYVLCIDMQCI